MSTPSVVQLRIRQFDLLDVTLDDGSIHTGRAQSNPYQLNDGTWFVLVDGIERAVPLSSCNDHDPTPWCIGCGAMTQEKCDCGPIADNN